MKKSLKVAASMAIITSVVGLTIMGTSAYFTARKTLSTNKLTAGTLDLDVSSNGQVNEPIVIDNIGENGTIGGTKQWTVRNTGTISGRLYARLENVVNEENGCNGPETEAEPNCAADNAGELGKAIKVDLSLDGVVKATSSLSNEDQTKIADEWAAIEPVILAPGESKTLKIDWNGGMENFGNEVQSDTTKFDMAFRLTQQTN